MLLSSKPPTCMPYPPSRNLAVPAHWRSNIVRDKCYGVFRAASHAGGAADGSSSGSSSGSNSSSSNRSSDEQPVSSPPDSTGPLSWIKQTFGSSKLDKQKLAEYGLGAFAAYGIISNLNAGVLVTLAWMSVVKQTGLTPLDPGMWPRFLAIYAGLYLTTNLLRPVRLTLALTVAPAFNKALEWIQKTLRVNKATAFGVMLAGIAVSSFTCIGTAIVLCGGFPNGLPALPWKR